MANKKETAEVEIKLSADEAKAKIKDLEKAALDLGKQLSLPNIDPAARTKLAEDLNKIESDIVKIKGSVKSTSDVRLTINGDTANKSITDLNKALAVLQREWKAATSEESKNVKAQQIAEVQIAIQNANKSIGDFKRELQLAGEDGSVNQLKLKAEILVAELNKLSPATQAFITRSEELAQVQQEMLNITTATEAARAKLVSFGEGGSLASLKNKAEQLRTELSLLAPESQKFAAKAAELAKVENEIGQIDERTKRLKAQFTDLGASNSFLALKAKADALRVEIDKLSPSTQEFLSKTKELQSVNTQMQKLNTTIQGTGGFFSGLSKEVKQFGVIAASYLGFQAMASQVTNIISKNAKLSDSLADIRRVAGLTEAEVKKLNEELGKIDTRTGTAALREIAIVAGKLGVAKEDIASFTQEVDKLVVTLGDELGDADAITTSLGKILNVFEGKITAENISQLGNAFVVLANKGVATGGFIADFTQRLSGIAKTANLSLPATVGLAAGLEELGQKVESSSTAVSKLVVTIGQDLPKAAAIAGAKSKEEVDKFTQLYAEAPQEALLKYAQGLTKNKESFAEIASSFKDAGEEGARVIGTLAQLGEKADFIRLKINDAADAMTNSSAINDAFALKNETLGAQLDKLGKKFYAVFSNQTVNKFFADLVRSINTFMDVSVPALKFLSDYKEAIILAATAYLTFKKGAELSEAANKKLASFLNADLDSALTKSKNGFAALNATMKANPAGALIIGLQIAIGVFAAIRSAQERHRAEIEKTIAAQKRFENTMIDSESAVNAEFDALARANEGSAERSRIIKEINEKYGQYLPNLLTEKSSLDEIELAQYAVIRAMKERIILEDDLNSKKELYAKQVSLEEQLSKKTGGLVKSLDDLKFYPGLLKKISDDEKAYGKEGLLFKLKAIDVEIQKLDELKNKRLEAEGISTMGPVDQGEGFGPAPPKKDTTRILTSDEVKALEDYKAKLETIFAQINKARIDGIQDAYAKESETLNAKYEGERAAAIKSLAALKADANATKDQKAEYEKETNALLLQLQANYYQDRQELAAKTQKQLSEIEFNQDIKNLQEGYAKEKLFIAQQYADGIDNRQQYEEKLAKLELQFLNEKLQNYRDYGKDTTEIEQQIADKKAGITKAEAKDDLNYLREKLALQKGLLDQYSDEALAITVKQIQNERDIKLQSYKDDAEMRALIEKQANKDIAAANQAHLIEQANQYADYAEKVSQVISLYNQIQDQKAEQELNQYKHQQDQQRLALDKRLESGLISRENYDKQVEDMDAAYQRRAAEFRKEEFNRKKTLAIIDVTINTARAVMADVAKEGYAGYVLGALDIALGALQIGLIASQKPPEFRSGVFLAPDKLHVIDGPTHEQGGLRITNTQTGQDVGYMEGGEGVYITSQKTTGQVKEVLDDAVRIGNSNDELLAAQATTGRPSKPLINVVSDTQPPAVPPSPFGEGRGEVTDSKALINELPPPPPGTDRPSKPLINVIGDTQPPAVTPSPFGEGRGEADKPSKPLINATEVTEPVTGRTSKPLINKDSDAATPPLGVGGLDSKALINAVEPPDPLSGKLSQGDIMFNTVMEAMRNSKIQLPASGIQIPASSFQIPNSIPQLNTGRIAENLVGSRNGYANVDQKNGQNVQPPQRIEPNNFNNAMDPFQTEMLNTLKEVKATLTQVKTAYEDPKHISASVRLQDINDKQKLLDQVKSNAALA